MVIIELLFTQNIIYYESDMIKLIKFSSFYILIIEKKCKTHKKLFIS